MKGPVWETRKNVT